MSGGLDKDHEAPKWKPRLLGIVAALVIFGLALVAGVSIANAATTQQTANATAAWLQNDVLHAHVDTRTIVVTTHLYAATSAGEFDATDGTIRLRPEIDAAVPAEIANQGIFGAEAAHVLIHESLHRAETVACWGSQATNGGTEEGIVDALAVDLLPAWGVRFSGVALHSPAFYPQDVSNVRHAVMRATGSRRWNRPERLYLRKVWAADCPGRAVLLSAVAP